MGINYYAVIDEHPNCPCDKCHKTTRKHIGKSSVGWSFLFKGYRHEIESYYDWRMFLNRFHVRIQNEYGDQISLNNFLWMIDEKKDDKKQKVTKGYDNWIDEHGNHFSGYEFS